MKSWIAFIIFGSAAIVAGGCGGSHTQQTVPNIYGGKWTGTWTGPETKDTGTFTLTIDAYGNLTGTIVRTNGDSGTMGGAVTGNGKFNATATFTENGNYVMSGQMAETNTGVNGNFTYWWNGTLYVGTFTTTGTGL